MKQSSLLPDASVNPKRIRRDYPELARLVDAGARRRWLIADRSAGPRQRELWAVPARNRRAADRACHRHIRRWLCFRSTKGEGMDGGGIEILVDCLAVELCERIQHLEPGRAITAARRALRGHRAAVQSGRWRRLWGAVQARRARKRSLPRLEACAARDRGIVRMRRRGASWRQLAASAGVSPACAFGAGARLERGKRMRAAVNLRIRERRQRVSLGVHRAIRSVRGSSTSVLKVKRSESRAATSRVREAQSTGADIRTARLRNGDTPHFYLRRVAYGFIVQGRRGVDLAELVKCAAARAHVPYRGDAVYSAVRSAEYLVSRAREPCERRAASGPERWFTYPFALLGLRFGRG